MNDILILGIAGGSGSGKTTLTDNLLKHFGEQVTVIHHDNYYRAHNDLTLEERRALNYDCPDAFETELMVEHLRLLRQGFKADFLIACAARSGYQRHEQQ